MGHGRLATGAILVWAAMGWGTAAGAQQPTPFGGQDASGRSVRPGERDTAVEKMQEQAAKGRNAERQHRLELDTAKLLSLATELKQDVDKTDKNTLSIEVIKKADEIEKLARSVKERMKG